MALDKVLKIYDENGNPVDYDILASDVKFLPDGKDLPTKLTEMEDAIEDAAEGGGYTPPQGGIPKGDLTQSVQDSLELADSSLQPSDKTQLQAAINAVQTALNNLIGSGNVQGAIDTFNEVTAFLNGIDTSDPTLKNQLLALSNAITALQTALNSKANSADVVKSVSVNGTAQSKDTNGNVNVVVPTLTFDTTPTAGHTTQVMSSDSIKTAIDLVTPTIDENGKWVIGGVTTDKDAQGPRGNTVLVNENAQGIQALIVNNVVDGGETDILSAEMGKVIRQNIMKIFNALGTYAFPNGKPILSWGNTIIRHNINTEGVTGGLTITDVEVDGTSVGSLPAQIADGKSLSFKLTKTASQLYRGVSISMDNTDITEDTGVWDETTGMVTITHVTGDIVVVASALPLVEYLQSDGNQWIDTGIVAGAGFKCEIKADVQAADTAWHRLLAARDADATFAIAVGLRPTSESGCLYAQFGQAPNTCITFNNQQVTGLHTIITELTGTALSIKVDGVDCSVNNHTTSSLSFPNLSLYMFSNHRQDSTIESISAKVYYCKIWNGSDLLFDAIPVRVGQVGYMYDKVSGELLGNIGTGSFTLGNDLTV